MSSLLGSTNTSSSMPTHGISSHLALKEVNESVSSTSVSITPKLETTFKTDDTSIISNFQENSKKSIKQCFDELSAVEAAILRSAAPIDIKQAEEITVMGQHGIWANKCEVINWKGPLPINQYSLNKDNNPEVIFKKSTQNLEYIQELAVRYLKPSTPPPPGDIIITQEPNLLTPPAPPVIIRQQPARPYTPKPLVIRESPPKKPPMLGRKLITISGKQLPPPPRKVVIERLPSLPNKPQPLIVERWLPYRPNCKRRIIFQHAPPDPVVIKPKNVLIQWCPPEVSIRQEIKYLGVIKANPIEYAERYRDTLKTADQLPRIVTNIQNPEGIVLAADQPPSKMLPELEGEIEALKLIDLEAQGLGEYKSVVYKTEKPECPESKLTDTDITSPPINSNPSENHDYPAVVSETNNTTIIVNSSPIAPAIDTSKLATPVSEPITQIALNSTFSPCSNSHPDFDSTPIPQGEQSQPSQEDSVSSPSTSALDLQSSNLEDSHVFNESNLTLTSVQLNSSIEKSSPVKTAESSLLVNQENTSLFSNLSTVQAPVENHKVENIDCITTFNANHSTAVSTAPNSMQSNELTLVTPSIPPIVPGTPVSSVLSSRLSLKSASIALLSASASATSVSTFPTTTLNASTGYGLSNFQTTSSTSYQSSHYISTAYPTLSGATLYSNQAEIFESPVESSSKEVTSSDVLETSFKEAELSSKIDIPVTDISSTSSTKQTVQSTVVISPTLGALKLRKSVADSVIERLFTLIDINGDGVVSIEEAERVFMKLNTRLGRNYSSHDVKNFFQSLDPAGTGRINMEQFKKAFPNRI